LPSIVGFFDALAKKNKDGGFLSPNFFRCPLYPVLYLPLFKIQGFLPFFFQHTLLAKGNPVNPFKITWLRKIKRQNQEITFFTLFSSAIFTFSFLIFSVSIRVNPWLNQFKRQKAKLRNFPFAFSFFTFF